jgi:hypothetical protein
MQPGFQFLDETTNTAGPTVSGHARERRRVPMRGRFHSVEGRSILETRPLLR